MSGHVNEETRSARSFAEEVATVLIWNLRRHRRNSKRRGDLREASATESRIERVRCQRRLMRGIDDPVVIRACADEWQSELSMLEVMLDASAIS